MVAKILLCVAFCFTLTQVSLARSDQVYFGYKDGDETTTVSPPNCMEGMQNVRIHFQELLNVTADVPAEIQQTLKKALQCLKGQEKLKCIKNTIKDSVNNFKIIKTQFKATFSKLVESIHDVMETCRGYLNVIQSFELLGLEYMN